MLDKNILNPPSSVAALFKFNLRLNYQKLATQIICKMRGDITQRQLSEMLGYTFNQVGKWESGVTQIKWDDFFLLGQVLGIPMEKHFRYSFWTLEKDFTAFTALKALESNLSFSSILDADTRVAIKKWLSGSKVPDLAEVLKLIGTKSPTLFGWLSLFVNCSSIPLLKSPYAIFLQNLDSVLNDPLVVYVNAALQLEAYEKLEFHNEEFLAEHSACTRQQAQLALKTLLSHGLITYDGKKYRPCPFDFSFSGLRHHKLRGLTKHTTSLAASRYSEIPIFIDPTKVRNPSQSSVRVVALSTEAAKQVVNLIAKFHNDVGEIVNQDQHPKDNVQVILIHSFASNINAKLDC